MSEHLVVVAAAVVERDGRFLVTQRAPGTHLGGCWEFPGGKCESEESLHDALRREMVEELDVAIDIDELLDTVEHAYPDRTVRLHFYRCRLKGKLRPRQGQATQWVTRAELASLEFPPADAALIEKLVSDR